MLSRFMKLEKHILKPPWIFVYWHPNCVIPSINFWYGSLRINGEK